MRVWERGERGKPCQAPRGATNAGPWGLTFDGGQWPRQDKTREIDVINEACEVSR